MTGTLVELGDDDESIVVRTLDGDTSDVDTGGDGSVATLDEFTEPGLALSIVYGYAVRILLAFGILY